MSAAPVFPGATSVIDAFDAGRDPGLAAARVAAVSAAPDFGMCGRLHRYDTRAVAATATEGDE
ncbi:hypothetical protein [Agromyces sp. H66]|uniref:hypothetical protein n=1 Tax=Agromyces sp. H66 TaxID=2529859 RepID=UPI0010A9B0D8|nr:hypothetical protein [Agromyces sp. H66]